jgi:hypothetical protein
MDDIDKILYPSIVTYILVMIIILLIKPKFLYDKNTKQLKQFGTRNTQTIFTLPLLSIILSIIIYFMMVCYIFMTSKLK